MPHSALRSQPGFFALYLVQFFGALNDNLFRAALVTLVAFSFAGTGAQAALLNNLAMALFILPMVLLSPLAGQLADRLDKAAMVRKNKLFELAISGLSLAALISMDLALMMLVLTLLGAQSAMFGPNKYALIPQLLPGYLLARGNASIAGGTFIAISLGTLLGTWMASGHLPFWSIALVMIAFSLCGLGAAFRLPPVERGAQDLVIDRNLFRAALNGIQLARRDSGLSSAILALSWFWFFGAGFLTQLPTWSRYTLGDQASSLAISLSCLILGLLLGALAAGRSGRQRLETGLVLPSLLALVGLGSLFACLPLWITAESELAPGNQFQLLVFSLLALLGISGGLFLVPLYALLQQRSNLKERARIIAANNLVNSLFMILAALLGFILFGLLENGLIPYFLIIAASGLLLVKQLSVHAQASWRLVGMVISRLVYRVEIRGREQIPEKGPVLFVCNHLSYADSIVLFGAIERPTRFIMEDKYWRIPLFNPVLRSAGTIPICSPFTDRRTFEQALLEAVETLRRGEAVFIFPEGRLSPAGETISFKRGVERILEQQPATLVPVALKGLWGSWFSHGGGKPALTGWPKPSRRRVQVSFGQPVPGNQLNAEQMRGKVLELLEALPD